MRHEGTRTHAGLASTPRLRGAWRPLAVARLARELRLHHRATAEHSHRLATLSRRIADHLGLDPLEATEAELVAVLHDVGKMAIDPALLDWPGRLTPAQREEIRRHTIEGEDLLARTAGLEHLAGPVRATHEAWDGSGYPDGLAGDAIPLTARIVACADAYDAMTSHRSYRRALAHEEACARIRAGAGAQWDPRVAGALMALVEAPRTTRAFVVVAG